MKQLEIDYINMANTYCECSSLSLNDTTDSFIDIRIKDATGHAKEFSTLIVNAVNEIIKELPITAPSTPVDVEDKQTESNKLPLYKVLKEEATENGYGLLHYSPIDMDGAILSDVTGFVMEAPNDIVGKYTVMSYNNLHILAEALENILTHSDDAEAKRLSKQALQNIS